jgi:hypothetical protein
MLRLTRRRLSNENGSAVVGFAIGAPLVLGIFIGFVEVTQVSWKLIISQTNQKLQLQDFAQDPSQSTRSDLWSLKLAEVEVVRPKGSQWNLWRVKE